MYMVYWTTMEADARRPNAREFASADMTAAMKFMEELRTRQRAGERICFVAMASENPDAVGNPGVADPPAGYNWKKRRS
jgi:hypothetical protein